MQPPVPSGLNQPQPPSTFQQPHPFHQAPVANSVPFPIEQLQSQKSSLDKPMSLDQPPLFDDVQVSLPVSKRESQTNLDMDLGELLPPFKRQD